MQKYWASISSLFKICGRYSEREVNYMNVGSTCYTARIMVSEKKKELWCLLLMSMSPGPGDCMPAGQVTVLNTAFHGLGNYSWSVLLFFLMLPQPSQHCYLCTQIPGKRKKNTGFRVSHLLAIKKNNKIEANNYQVFTYANLLISCSPCNSWNWCCYNPYILGNWSISLVNYGEIFTSHFLLL